MIVKYLKDRRGKIDAQDPFLTLGKNYIVLGISFSTKGDVEYCVDADANEGPGLVNVEFLGSLIIQFLLVLHFICMSMASLGYNH